MIAESPPTKYRVKPYVLATLMEDREMSSRELAKLSGVSKSRISEIANGKAPHIYRRTGKQIAKALKVKPAVLFLTEL